jgi:YVTN family beta-propeller protein
VAATVGVGGKPLGVAVSPDGKFVYVANDTFNSVSVIATATNVVVATVGVGSSGAEGVAVTPDGNFVYVASPSGGGMVSVIATASSTVAATVGVGSFPNAVAVSPDGKFVYVTNFGSNNVSVIATATNTVVATIGVGSGPDGVGIIPPPLGVPFSDCKAALDIDLDPQPRGDAFMLFSEFTLGQNSNGISPPTEPVTLKVGTFTTTIPAGSFKASGFGTFYFVGVVTGVHLGVGIAQTGAKRYAFAAAAQKPSLTGTVNPVPVTVTIGDDSGTVSVKADIDH